LAEDFKVAGLKIQAIGARTQEKADEFADQFGIPNRHDSYEKLVNDPEVDIVYVATPHPMHKRDSILAINAGKHVLCEKPLTINAKEAQEIEAAAKAKGVFFF
jgi:predicted dehydrogenase